MGNIYLTKIIYTQNFCSTIMIYSLANKFVFLTDFTNRISQSDVTAMLHSRQIIFQNKSYYYVNVTYLRRQKVVFTNLNKKYNKRNSDNQHLREDCCQNF